MEGNRRGTCIVHGMQNQEGVRGVKGVSVPIFARDDSFGVEGYREEKEKIEGLDRALFFRHHAVNHQ